MLHSCGDFIALQKTDMEKCCTSFGLEQSAKRDGESPDITKTWASGTWMSHETAFCPARSCCKLACAQCRGSPSRTAIGAGPSALAMWLSSKLSMLTEACINQRSGQCSKMNVCSIDVGFQNFSLWEILSRAFSESI